MSSKPLRIVLSLILAAVVFPACTKKQGPTRADTQIGGPGTRGDFGGDIVPLDSETRGFGIPAELEERNTGTGGIYGGRDTQEGLLPSVYFGFDSASVSASERFKLEEAADYLMANPDDELVIEGHADWYGTSEYNLALGDRRAASVRDYLTTLGVSGTRIETLSKGSLEATSGLSKSQASEDRRADLIILK